MRRAHLSIVLCLAAAPAFAGPVATPAPPPVRIAPVTYAVGTSTDYALVELGSLAPDFSFESTPGWRRLHDLRTGGDLLLVFGADESALLALDRERGALEALGVIAVAVVDRKPGACHALVARLDLGLRVVPDPQRAIGAQFNALDPHSRADAPAWFVLDRTGRVRGLGRFDWPAQPWSRVAAGALGLEASPASTVSFGGR